MAHRFGFTVVGRYRTHLKANEPAVTVNMTSGQDDHLTYAGTLTMSEAEWETFLGALRGSLGEDGVEVEDRKAPETA